ncbi:MAG TPA: hypothetical protein VL547_09195 [Dinghuibacter sp.]|jgi:hypothetical protein|uniref:hypothetical protein n=1 Tax=Dinghuibacter sp. TaxID=2024697 RepID=UPI002BB56791|nr:hypothetical protein [Dinghuibacter sp.]HTJ12189.1 hypothetical protein [Dinghuibacter sp.]
MSAHDFQLAMGNLIASPALCRSLLSDGAPVLSAFDLSPRELSRLLAVVHQQKGMSACCTLYRMNRITPLYGQLSNSCMLLGDRLAPLVEAFWSEMRDTTMQFKHEVLAFGQFLLRQPPDIPYLRDVLTLELAMNELSYAAGERYLRFDHDIFSLLAALRSGTLESADIAPSSTRYRLYIREHEITMEEAYI